MYGLKILIDVTHPAHVHLFRNAIRIWQQRGHSVIITARQKDVTTRLLDEYGFDYLNLGPGSRGRAGLLKEMAYRESRLYQLAKRERPDVMASVGAAFIGRVGRLAGIPTIAFSDTEHARLFHRITFPFVDHICTPSCFMRDLGRKQVRYAGYHELAYTHPNRFTPDRGVLQELGIPVGEPYVVLRFVSWDAHHDVGQKGFPLDLKLDAVRKLGQHARVYVTAEGTLPPELAAYQLKVPVSRILDVLAHAQLYLGEGATMAVEAGLLGTPAVYVSSLVGTMGNFVELMDRYALVYSYTDAQAGLQQAQQLLSQPDVKQVWAERRERLLDDKIDVTAWMVDFVEQVGQTKSSSK